jgi:hypothetical protein
MTPVPLDDSVLPFWMVRPPVTPAVVPMDTLPVVAVAEPDTPSTAAFGVCVLMVTLPVGAVPVDQLLPTVQSALVVPFHTCALAGDDQQPIASIAAPTPASSALHRQPPPPLLPRRPVNSDATTHTPNASDQRMRNMRFILNFPRNEFELQLNKLAYADRLHVQYGRTPARALVYAAPFNQDYCFLRLSQNRD